MPQDQQQSREDDTKEVPALETKKTTPPVLAASLEASIAQLRSGGRPPDLAALRELAGAFVLELYPDATSAALVVELTGRDTAVLPLWLPGVTTPGPCAAG
jgi:hypothetical protein